MNPNHQCCHNPQCEFRGLYDKGNIGVHSQKDKRYICHRCRKTFAATLGTPLYRKQYEHTFFAEVVSLLAHGCPVQAIVATYSIDERTVSAWQKESGEHCQRVHEAESRPQELLQVQADEIRLKAQGMILWIAMAIAIPTRFWLGAEVSEHRDWSLVHALAEKVKAWSLCRAMLIVFDGFRRIRVLLLRRSAPPYPQESEADRTSSSGRRWSLDASSSKRSLVALPPSNAPLCAVQSSQQSNSSRARKPRLAAFSIPRSLSVSMQRYAPV